MIYKAIPGPKTIIIKDGDVMSATNLFAEIINAQAQQGWTYHSMETITTQETVGCLFSKQVINTNHYMLIFCREQ